MPEEKTNNRVCAVAVCIDYADMLAISLPVNRDVVDRMLVITLPTDSVTRRLCDRLGVETYLCDEERLRKPGIQMWSENAPNRDGGEPPPFWNKGAIINDGLRHLQETGDGKCWWLHLDSDIVLPPSFSTVRHMTLYRSRLYGCHRVECSNVHELSEWLVGNKRSQRMKRLRSKPGYGYFQLFHPLAPCFNVPPFYPEVAGFAAISDTMFRKKFERISSLTFDVLHLSHGEHMKNWWGRDPKSPRIWQEASGVVPDVTEEPST